MPSKCHLVQGSGIRLPRTYMDCSPAGRYTGSMDAEASGVHAVVAAILTALGMGAGYRVRGKRGQSTEDAPTTAQFEQLQTKVEKMLEDFHEAEKQMVAIREHVKQNQVRLKKLDKLDKMANDQLEILKHLKELKHA